MQFKVGDVVCLKSGSPSMTITAIREDGFCILGFFVSVNGMYSRYEEIEEIPVAVLTAA